MKQWEPNKRKQILWLGSILFVVSFAASASWLDKLIQFRKSAFDACSRLLGGEPSAPSNSTPAKPSLEAQKLIDETLVFKGADTGHQSFDLDQTAARQNALLKKWREDWAIDPTDVSHELLFELIASSATPSIGFSAIKYAVELNSEISDTSYAHLEHWLRRISPKVDARQELLAEVSKLNLTNAQKKRAREYILVGTMDGGKLYSNLRGTNDLMLQDPFVEYI